MLFPRRGRVEDAIAVDDSRSELRVPKKMDQLARPKQVFREEVLRPGRILLQDKAATCENQARCVTRNANSVRTSARQAVAELAGNALRSLRVICGRHIHRAAVLTEARAQTSSSHDQQYTCRRHCA